MSFQIDFKVTNETVQPKNSLQQNLPLFKIYSDKSQMKAHISHINSSVITALSWFLAHLLWHI
jgi:hypothetical protein